jgi:hypothetical protein
MSFGSQQMPMASNMGQQQQRMGMQHPQGLMPMYPGDAPQSGMMPQMGQMPPQGQMGGIGGLMPDYMMGIEAYSQPMNEMLPMDPAKPDQRPTNMDPSAIGSHASYRPTMGPVTASVMPQPMNGGIAGLPNSIENQLPPSLKRPTQGSYNKFK